MVLAARGGGENPSLPAAVSGRAQKQDHGRVSLLPGYFRNIAATRTLSGTLNQEPKQWTKIASKARPSKSRVPSRKVLARSPATPSSSPRERRTRLKVRCRTP